MDDAFRQKQAEQQNAADPFGEDASQVRLFEETAANRRWASIMSRWPTQPMAPIQDQVTGQLHFIPGISDPGGDDLIV